MRNQAAPEITAGIKANILWIEKERMMNHYNFEERENKSHTRFVRKTCLIFTALAGDIYPAAPLVTSRLEDNNNIWCRFLCRFDAHTCNFRSSATPV
ncbi:hypothetical protein TNCV_3531451 [Trichonephila clavipes]|nr:hypothetical protein TNCV_3531451 [Trichonephila clavipes]